MPCALNFARSVPHYWAVRPQPHTEGSAPACRAPLTAPACQAPLTAHRGVPTLGQRALKHREGFSPAGRGPCTAHAVVPTSRPRALEHTQRAPNSRATHHHPSSNRSSRLYALPQLHAKDAPPVGSAPSTAHGVVLTTSSCSLHAQEGRPHSPAMGLQRRTEGVPTRGQRALNWARRYPIPEKCTDGSLLVGLTP